MQRLRDSSITAGPNVVSGTFGVIQVGAYEQSVVLDIVACNYDTTGYLHTDHCHLHLPLDAANRLYAAIGEMVIATEEQGDARQTALWPTVFR